MRELHIPRAERERLAVPASVAGLPWVMAQQSYVMAQASGAAAPGPGDYEYEISKEDRDTIEQAIRDNNSDDLLRRKAALDSWSDTLWNIAPEMGPFMLSGVAASLILDFLGKHVLQPFDLTDNGSELGYADTGSWSVAVTRLSVGQPYTYTDGTPVVDATVSIAMTLRNWTCDRVFYDQNYGMYRLRYNMNIVCFDAVAADHAAALKATSGDDDTCATFGFDAQVSDPSDNSCAVSPLKRKPMPYQAPLPTTKTRTYTLQYSSGWCYRTRWGANYGTKIVCPGGDSGIQKPGVLGAPSLSDLPNSDISLDAGQIQDLANGLRSSPWGKDFYQPPDDVKLPGPNDNPYPEPGSENYPCGPGNMGTPVGHLRHLGGGRGSPVTKFHDPNGWPGGREPGDDMCFGVGADTLGCGKLKKWKPPGSGIVQHPPYTDKYFDAPWCRKNILVTDAVGQLATLLGLSMTGIVNSNCTKRWTGCFKKGSNIFDAMWELADMCNVYPDRGDGGGGGIEEEKPLNIHYGPYHELVNLFVFDPVYQDFDAYDFVEVTRPNYRDLPGYSIVVPVRSPFTNSGDATQRVLTKIVDRKTSRADAIDLAGNLAARAARVTRTIECAVPYLAGAKRLGQFYVNRPSLDFAQNYVLDEFEHDLSLDNGYITKLKGWAIDDADNPYPPAVFEPAGMPAFASGV